MYFCSMKIEISLGSNTCAAENMRAAKELLAMLLPGITFGEEVWTKPYATPAIPHPTTPYLNCLARAETPLEQSHLAAKLKQVEQSLGDSHANHQRGVVLMDIDLLSYGGKTVKEKRW